MKASNGIVVDYSNIVTSIGWTAESGCNRSVSQVKNETVTLVLLSSAHPRRFFHSSTMPLASFYWHIFYHIFLYQNWKENWAGNIAGVHFAFTRDTVASCRRIKRVRSTIEASNGTLVKSSWNSKRIVAREWTENRLTPENTRVLNLFTPAAVYPL